jgi:hypothetical protein
MRVSLNPRGHGHNFAFLHQRILAIFPRALQRLPHVGFADGLGAPAMDDSQLCRRNSFS